MVVEVRVTATFLDAGVGTSTTPSFLESEIASVRVRVRVRVRGRVRVRDIVMARAKVMAITLYTKI